jgi:hypothetical protein
MPRRRHHTKRDRSPPQTAESEQASKRHHRSSDDEIAAPSRAASVAAPSATPASAAQRAPADVWQMVFSACPFTDALQLSKVSKGVRVAACRTKAWQGKSLLLVAATDADVPEDMACVRIERDNPSWVNDGSLIAHRNPWSVTRQLLLEGGGVPLDALSSERRFAEWLLSQDPDDLAYDNPLVERHDPKTVPLTELAERRGRAWMSDHSRVSAVDPVFEMTVLDDLPLDAHPFVGQRLCGSMEQEGGQVNLWWHRDEEKELLIDPVRQDTRIHQQRAHHTWWRLAHSCVQADPHRRKAVSDLLAQASPLAAAIRAAVGRCD